MTEKIPRCECLELLPIVPRCWLHRLMMQPVFEDSRQKRWRCNEQACAEVHVHEKSN